MADKTQQDKTSTRIAINLGLSDLVEPTIRQEVAADSLDLLEQLKGIESQLLNKSLPRALLAESLIALKLAVKNQGEATPAAILFGALKERLLSEEGTFVLSDELQLRLKAPLLSEPCATRSHSIDRFVEQLPVDCPSSQLNQFSSLVRSIDDRRKEGLNQSQERPKSPSASHRLIAALLICLIFAAFIIKYRYSNKVEEKVAFLPIPQVNSADALPSDTRLALPSFEPIRTIGALSSLAYELQQPLERPSNKNKPIPQAYLKSSLNHKKEHLKIGASDEPLQVRELQTSPEQKVVENEIDFPPFRSQSARPVLKAPNTISAGQALERFNVPQPYTVMVATDIMPRPSYYGESVGALRSGEQILVDALVGPWVRFRLGDGRPGFVLAQDVTGARQ